MSTNGLCTGDFDQYLLKHRFTFRLDVKYLGFIEFIFVLKRCKSEVGVCPCLCDYVSRTCRGRAERFICVEQIQGSSGIGKPGALSTRVVFTYVDMHTSRFNCTPSERGLLHSLTIIAPTSVLRTNEQLRIGYVFIITAIV